MNELLARTDYYDLPAQDAERELRVQLAAAYRLVDHFGWTELIYGHLTARVPGPEPHFLINPYGLNYDEITASNLVKIDCDGNIVEPSDYPINHAGFVIHSAVHMANSTEHKCVMHTHTRAGMAVCSMQCGLLPMTQTSMRFVDHLGYHDYEGPAVDLAERERLVHDLGPHDAMILRNHGLLTCGATIQQAFNTMYQLEMSCRSQVDAMAGGQQIVLPPREVIDHTANLYQPGTRRPYGVLEWHAMLRLLDAESKNSGYPPYWH